MYVCVGVGGLVGGINYKEGELYGQTENEICRQNSNAPTAAHDVNLASVRRQMESVRSFVLLTIARSHPLTGRHTHTVTHDDERSIKY